MRIHLLEHDPIDMSRINITIWAKNAETFRTNYV